MAGSIFIPIISAFDSKGVTQAKGAIAGLAGVVKNLKATAAAAAISFATIGAVGFAKDAVTAARDLERNMVGLEGVFGDVSPTMQQFAKDASAIGMSQVEASRASTFLGSVLKQSGFTMQDTAVQTKNLVGLASDLAATYGYDVSEALTGMTALFRGEYDPIEKFGVAMKQAEVNALLAARGQKNLTGAALRNAQAQARLDLLYSRSQDAQGAYARQSDSLFVKQKNLTAAFENMKASVGAALTDPLATLLDAITPLVEQVGPMLTPMFGTLAKVVKVLTPLIDPLAQVVFLLWEALTPLIDVLVDLIQPLMMPLVSVVQLLGAVMKPLIPIITFVARLLGAVLSPIVLSISLMLNALVQGFVSLFDALSGMPIFGGWFKDANNNLKGFMDGFSSLNDMITGTTKSSNGLTAVLSKDIPSNPIDTVTTATQKATAGVNALKDAVQSLIDDAKNTQKSLMGAFDINKILEDNQDAITESIIYVDGKFKAVVSGVNKGSKDLVAKFASGLTQLRTFYKNLNKLADAGLSPELRQQLIDAGPAAGNATAEAILASGKAGIKGLNKTYAGIKSLAGTIGVQSAKAMASVGEKLGNGLIDGLISQRDNLIAQAAQIATDIANAAMDAMNETLKQREIRHNLATNTGNQDLLWSRNTYVSPITAGVDVGNRLNAVTNLVRANQLVNPFAVQDPGYQQFRRYQAVANKYDIAIKVAPGTAPREVAAALVRAISEYERTNGKGYRND